MGKIIASTKQGQKNVNATVDAGLKTGTKGYSVRSIGAKAEKPAAAVTSGKKIGKPAAKSADKSKKAPAKKAATGAKRAPVSREPKVPGTSKITLLVKENPKRGASAERYALYKTGMTVDAYVEAGGRRADIAWDVAHSYIKVA